MFYLLFIVGFCLIVLLVYIVSCYGSSLDEPHPVTNIDYLRYCQSDDLSKSIIALIDDIYSPFNPVRLSDHIVSDLDMDSLDIIDLLFDVEQICGARIVAAELYQQYGRNPTVAQLISYARHKVATPESKSASDTSPAQDSQPST